MHHQRRAQWKGEGYASRPFQKKNALRSLLLPFVSTHVKASGELSKEGTQAIAISEIKGTKEVHLVTNAKSDSLLLRRDLRIGFRAVNSRYCSLRAARQRRLFVR
jgi:hypothetical protein